MIINSILLKKKRKTTTHHLNSLNTKKKTMTYDFANPDPFCYNANDIRWYLVKVLIIITCLSSIQIMFRKANDFFYMW